MKYTEKRGAIGKMIWKSEYPIGKEWDILSGDYENSIKNRILYLTDEILKICQSDITADEELMLTRNEILASFTDFTVENDPTVKTMRDTEPGGWESQVAQENEHLQLRIMDKLLAIDSPPERNRVAHDIMLTIFPVLRARAEMEKAKAVEAERTRIGEWLDKRLNYPKRVLPPEGTWKISVNWDDLEALKSGQLPEGVEE